MLHISLNHLQIHFPDPDGFEFYIVSLDNKQWHFEAANSEERDDWVSIIEQEIFKSLQGNESSKPKTQNSNDVAQAMQNIRTQVPGNGFCVDCDSPSECFTIYFHTS
jgi:Arf-GAP with GTPase, ANK repeat and PH domain-containing protein 1/3/4/5/6/9/11